MSQPPNQPPQQGGFGPPQEQPNQSASSEGGPDLTKSPQPAPGYGYPQTPSQPQTPPQPQGAPQTPPPPAQPPQTPPPPAGPPQPQPGYGYPQAPQPAPGYGYPQTSPQPNNPYAQPYGSQPGPYGTPQPGYGYPAQPPTVSMHPQGGQPGGGGKGRTQLAIILSAVVAIALIIGGGVWYSKSSGDDGKQNTASSDSDKGGTGGASSGGKEKVPANTASQVLFQVPMPEVTETVSTSGSWLTNKVYAKTGNAEIVGYDPVKGTKLWTLKLPGPVCQATRHVTSDNRTAILYEPAMPTATKRFHGCSQVAAIDLDTGKKLWTQTVKSGDQDVSLDNITISGGTVAVGSTSGGAAFSIADGKALWLPKPDDTCYDAGYGGGEKLVAVRKCGPYDQRQLHIQTIDPKSGKVISEYKMTKGIEYASIVSTNPLVVAADVNRSAGDGSGISDFFSIDNRTGKLRTRISAPGDKYAARCDNISRIEHCTGIAVGNDRLYVPTEQHDGTEEYTKTNEIVAFDLGTGKQTGQRADAGDGYQIYPLRMDGGNVIAYKRPPYNKGGQVVSIDGNTFKVTKLLENPASRNVRNAEMTMSPDYSEIHYSQGRLYMSAIHASKMRSAFGKQYLVLAFGASE
ncbi:MULTISPECIES: outer membrane protein assembly factor BamB family protein [Streptomyces]|uniref:PQQ-binding-like beta-propeller repeat protein n=2 Tax=Streptomyces TaxID=1883 RepID=A0ABN1SXV8_9ACTN|nr:PQQ-binding-like beta-propeller repeat protein [Streptomyces sp. F-3]